MWGKGATARKQKESRSFERLSCSLARIATPERTYSYVSIHDGGADKVVRQMTPEGPDGDISMKCKESACGMDRSVLMRT